MDLYFDDLTERLLRAVDMPTKAMVHAYVLEREPRWTSAPKIRDLAMIVCDRKGIPRRKVRFTSNVDTIRKHLLKFEDIFVTSLDGQGYAHTELGHDALKLVAGLALDYMANHDFPLFDVVNHRRNLPLMFKFIEAVYFHNLTGTLEILDYMGVPFTKANQQTIDCYVDGFSRTGLLEVGYDVRNRHNYRRILKPTEKGAELVPLFYKGFVIPVSRFTELLGKGKKDEAVEFIGNGGRVRQFTFQMYPGDTPCIRALRTFVPTYLRDNSNDIVLKEGDEDPQIVFVDCSEVDPSKFYKSSRVVGVTNTLYDANLLVNCGKPVVDYAVDSRVLADLNHPDRAFLRERMQEVVLSLLKHRERYIGCIFGFNGR